MKYHITSAYLSLIHKILSIYHHKEISIIRNSQSNKIHITIYENQSCFMLFNGNSNWPSHLKRLHFNTISPLRITIACTTIYQVK